MRIWHLSTGIQRIPPDKTGGPERHFTLLSRQLVRLGHEVTIIDRKHASSDSDAEQVDGITVVRLSVLFLPRGWLESQFPLLYWPRSAINTVLFTMGASKYLKGRSGDFDLLNTHVILSAFLLVALHKTWRSRIVYNHHAAFWPSPTGGVLTRLLSLLGNFAMRRMRSVIVLNDSVKNHFVTRLKLPESKIFVLPSGVDVNLFHTDKPIEGTTLGPRTAGTRTVLFVGRINPMKGLETLVRAANIIVNQAGRRDVMFLLVGPFESVETNTPGSYTAKLNSLIRGFSLENAVKFAGEVRFDDLKRIYSESDVFVLPSVAEQLPLVALEAMASGKPVIATMTPWALMWIKDRWNGMLVQVKDEKDLAEKILYLLDEPGEARRIGANAREFIRQFDWSSVAKSYAEAYRAENRVEVGTA